MSKVKLPKLSKKTAKSSQPLPAGVEEPVTEREKVEQRREEILARGRKFKYPLQYAKHRLIVNTIIIAVLVIAVLVGIGHLVLYNFQDTSDMVYRVTRFLPISVAEVDGEQVRYSDYLMIYRSTITPVEQQGGQTKSVEDVEAMRTHYKRAALTDAEIYTYAEKLGKELGITISEEQIDQTYDAHRKAGGADRSEESFLKILSDNFNLSKEEYRRMLYLSLMKMEVAQQIDTNASNIKDQIAAQIAAGNTDFGAIAGAFEGQVIYEETGGLIDLMNVDGGRAALAATLQPGQVSEAFTSESGDGYYFVKLIEKTEDNSKVSYMSLKIPFTEFDKRFEQLQKGNKITEKINIVEDAEQK